MQVRAEPTPRNNPPNPKVPSHVAIIMDGNGRWARKQGLPRLAGHKVGAGSIQSILECLSSKGVSFVTLFAFSTENWNRPEAEVQGILEVLYAALKEQAQALHEAGVRVIHIGKMHRLSPEVQQEVLRVQEQTAGNTGITLNVAFDYGGRDEILDAVQRVIRDGRSDGRKVQLLPFHRPLPRPGPDSPHRRGDAHQQFPPVAVRLQRVLPHPHALARLGLGRIGAGPRGLREPRKALRQS